MKTVFDKIKGDRIIWAIAALLAIFSFLPVYSAASNLAYVGSGSNTFSYFIKHFVHLFLGFSIIYGIHKIPYRYFRGLSMVMIPVVLILLIITMLQGATIGGANASRWIRVPIVGFAFQPSTLAALVLMVYVARYLSKIKDKIITIKGSILPLWLPVFIVLALILPANFSTAAIIFSMVVLLTYVGGYPFKYLSIIIGSGVVVLALFVLTAKAFPNLIPNRVDTWTSRISSFVDSEVTQEDYQIEKAKIAIATGGVKGLGPGKSIQKNFLPQSSSDFIFAIIIEEYGLIGGMVLLILYLWLLFRIVIVAQKSDSVFGKLLAIGVGLPVIFQALVNMGVAVQLFPVTGQTLPLISSGGTSIWVTCLALGIVLSVSSKRHEDKNKDMDDQHPLEILSEAL
ncbi:FtsW/RodA/SpoVE family cell cycle protein [Flavobacteriaceae bacterium]|jgi:cell division protein FtsW|nr:FtsW/RodA/SpoVE family cell cycle protein [Flavobacteriaceae bacterium]MDC0462668.1 FtsW/RodA/SpoVE family cell cycle protein [Flavobacteriaceae bacterium]|tara:strand:+ start:5385 stop:6578 length:1194 start_codon:yes stop_codon:yes gene_type:complete